MSNTTAREQMNAKITSMNDAQIVDALAAMNKDFYAYQPEERVVRVALLAEYESRHGGDAVDMLMDELEAALV